MTSFRFIHAADVHLNSQMAPVQRRIAAGQAPEEVVEAPALAFEKLIDLALDEEVDFIVISGDLYDNQPQSFDAERVTNDQLVRLIDKDKVIPVYVISGNHDAEMVHSDRLTLPTSNCRTFSSTEPETMKLTEFNPRLEVAIHGQGYLQRATTDNLVENYPAAVPGFFNIGLLHTSLDPAQPERSEGHPTYAPCSLADLKQLGYDYWALGHIHKRDEVNPRDPVVLFPGNLQGRHIKETGKKGATLVEVENGSVVAMTHHPLDVGRWAVIEMNQGGWATDGEFFEEAFERIEDELSDECSGGEGIGWLGLRFRIGGPTKAHSDLSKDTGRIEQELQTRANQASQRTGHPINVWIEKVEVKTRSEIDPKQAAERQDPLGEVIRQAQNPTEETVGAMVDSFDSLRTKLSDVGGGISLEDLTGVDTNDPQALRELMPEIEQILLGRVEAE